MGLLGYVDADRIVYYRAPLRRHTAGSEFDLRGIAQMPYVEVLYVHDGGHGGMAQAALTLGAQGLVVAGSGAGGLGNLETEIYRIVAERKALVVQASRVGEGRVVQRNNWFKEGMVAADSLSPHKAAMLLSLALTRTHSVGEIQRIFDEY
jgi:L-asparaginase